MPFAARESPAINAVLQIFNTVKLNANGSSALTNALANVEEL
jgi:hypothetical protein